MGNLQDTDREIRDAVRREEERQESGLELIASENYTSRAVMEAMGTVFTNKYSEGFAGKRYYAGNEIVDEVETLAIGRAADLFQAEHVNVQALSGSPANAAVYFATVKPGDKVMGLKLDHGGHLSHGHPVNFSGMMYNFVRYGVNEATGLLEMDRIREIALKERPKLLIAGFSAYSRNLDWQAFKDIGDEVGAVTFADIAHVAGLIAGKVLENPVPLFDIVTTTTHKTLRGPRGAIIMCKEKFKKAIDRSVFPGMQGGPHDHITAAKAVCFKEASTPEFQEYSRQVVKNAQTLSEALMGRGYKVLTDGTDNHMVIVDLTNKELTGKTAETALGTCGISISRSTIPGDTRKAMDPSGVRLGTPAATTRGMGAEEMKRIAGFIDEALADGEDPDKLQQVKSKVRIFVATSPYIGKILFCCLIFFQGLSFGQRNSGIAEIDSLPLRDWHIETPPLSYTKALAYSLLFPGGGHIYGKRYVRAGFLIGLEGFLYTDALIYKRTLLKAKNRAMGNSLDSADAYYRAYREDPANESLISAYRNKLDEARSIQDVKMSNLDLKKAELVWALGLHFYGVMDAMEIVYQSRQDTTVQLSGNKAFWRGLFFPGGGQLYNRKFGKFGMLWMAMGASMVSAYHRQQMVDYFQNRIKIAENEGQLPGEIERLTTRVTEFRKRRNQYYWAMAVLHLYALGDAVVDAVLNDFDHPDKFALAPGNELLSMVLEYRF